jgi:signal transduction histidine kinase/predicted ATPase
MIQDLPISQQLRGRIFDELECSELLSRYIQDMLDHPDREGSGVLVTGNKGTGKTAFIENHLSRFELLHPVLIARHYQQHEKIPYYGFKYCISDYVSKIYNRFSNSEFQQFSRSLKNHLGESFPLLLDYIPELSIITGRPPVSSRSMLTVENQLYPLFKRLFEFLADYSGRCVFFFTDDLQWIDASGINLLRYLLLNLPPGKMIWIGACRGSLNTSALKQLDEELELNKRRIEIISLNGFSPSEVQKFLEQTLGGRCSDDLVDVCYKLTRGNASHLQVLVESLKGSALIRLQDGEWTCDRHVVDGRYAGQNTELMLMETMNRLSSDAREVLSIIACMGRFNKRTILDWLDGDVALMESILKEAINTGLLTIGENEGHFTDMQTGEMLYLSLEPDERTSLHYRIANLLYERIDALSPTEFVLMVSNFNQATDLIRVEQKVKLVAELNYQAGKISRQENALEQARYFFRMSADLLKDCPWDEVLDQIYAVYMERARVEYVLGDYDLAEIHLDFLLERIPDPLRRASIFELKVTINNHLGRYLKVVRILKESLGELGLDLPTEESQLFAEVDRLTAALSSGGGAGGDLEPESRQAILKLLYVGGMGMHHTSDVLMRWAALQIILCSGVENVSPVKAIGCVSYGRMLIISNDIQRGYEFGLKGLEINDGLNDITLRCRVYGVYAFYILPWKRPFSESYAFLDKAAEAGQKSGDLIGLYIIKTHRLNVHLVSGLPLKDLPTLDFEKTWQGRDLTYYITNYQNSLLNFLTGKSPVFSMPRRDPAWLAAELTIQEEKFYRNYVWAKYYFLFGHYELAAAAANEADNNRKLQEGSPLHPANLLIWFLSMTQNWQNYSDEMQRKNDRRLREILNSFRLWQEHGPSNYRASWCLLNAEYERIQGNHDKAIAFFEESSSSAGTNVFHFAITEELWGRYLLTLPDEHHAACFHIEKAISGFHEWGAVAKMRQLTRQYQAVMSAVFPEKRYVTDEVDIETIQYELSGDMEVSSLVRKLMVLLLRVSGSTHSVLELVNANGDRILYNELSLLGGAGNRTPAQVPASLLLMALKSQTTIVVNDLASERSYRDIEVLRTSGVKSFLILPVTIQGHLSMVIYLENVFADQWYSNDRVRWTRITANQGAVIIENARIHERSVELNHELRREMAERERLASIIEGQKDAHLKALIKTQDDERKRIASDLHDSLGSLLSTVKLRFDGLVEDFERAVPEKAGRFTAAIDILDDAIQELRKISHNMLPVSLKRFGLRAALESFVEQVNASQRLETHLQILGLDRRLPEDIEVAGYRICQELVQNVIKHARATYVKVQVIDHKDSLNIIVEDNGKGMVEKEIARGFGFTTIQSKVDFFKGSFEIDSTPGRGTMVLVDLPVAV